MGTLEVLKKIEDSFVSCPLYYKIYAECLIENNKDEDLHFTFQKTMENCEITEEEVRKDWGPEIMSHVRMPVEDDGTVCLFEQYRNCDARKSAAFRKRSSIAPPKMDFILDDSDPKVHTSSTQPSITPAGGLLSIDSPPLITTKKKTTSTAAAAAQRPQNTVNAHAPQNTEEFSVFRDPTINRTTTIRISENSKRQLGNVAKAVPSPISKRTKRGDSLDDIQLTMTSEKENMRRSFDPNSPTLCRQPPAKNVDDLTICADIRPTTTSTPENPTRAGIPKFNPPANTKNVPFHEYTPEPNVPSANDVINTMKAMTIGGGDDSTGNGSATLEFQGPVNPWDPLDRQRIVEQAAVLNNQHSFRDEYAPNIDKGRTFSLGGEKFRTLKMIGHGAFAKVFRCESEADGEDFAVKYESPACPYEVHIVETLQRSIPENMKPFLMSVRDAYIFRNASAIVYDYLQYGNLLDLSNTFMLQNTEMFGGIITLIGLQLGAALQAIHKAQIIHGDLKPDNILIVGPSSKCRLEEMIHTPLIRVIDFGRAIDMQYYDGNTFTGRAKTDCFNCLEMLDDRPWTYQTDFYGYVATIYVLIHHKYMETKERDGRYCPALPVKRRMVHSAMWTEIFDRFLNIPSCNTIPDWTPILDEMRRKFLESASHDPLAWRNGVEKLNRFIQMNQGKTA